jgi:hypothetical protein
LREQPEGEDDVSGEARDHVAPPQEREPAWASSRPLALLARLMLLAAMALAIAVSVSEMLGSDPKLNPILESPRR